MLIFCLRLAGLLVSISYGDPRFILREVVTGEKYVFCRLWATGHCKSRKCLQRFIRKNAQSVSVNGGVFVFGRVSGNSPAVKEQPDANGTVARKIPHYGTVSFQTKYIFTCAVRFLPYRSMADKR